LFYTWLRLSDYPLIKEPPWLVLLRGSDHNTHAEILQTELAKTDISCFRRGGI